SDATVAAGPWPSDVISRGKVGRVPCPSCRQPMPVGREHVGGLVRCPRCRATSLVGLLSSDTVQLKLAESPRHSDASPTPVMIVQGPDDEPEVDSSAATVLAASQGAVAAGSVSRLPAHAARRLGPGGIRSAAIGLVALA